MEINSRALMSSSSQAASPLVDNWVVLGCGAVSVDYLAQVAAFPKPDDKIRSTSMKGSVRRSLRRLVAAYKAVVRGAVEEAIALEVFG
ncbi:hypothetical protein KSP40_PGU012935 [Platanthera guangdongensis]|uniref:Uncharacterized protein n=1 Tax=Platanthera guangdongensis TaxID=2320717 RepID=A0ABR2LNQ7_9ASPA